MDTVAAILPRFASKAEFLAWEEQQETRFEWDGEEVTEVTGGTANHILIMTAIARVLHGKLRGTPYLVIPQIKVETGPGYRYPDVTVGRRDFDHTTTIVPAPVVVFEVLSPSMSRVDPGRKRAEYQDVPTIARYVQVESRRVSVQAFAPRPGRLVGRAGGGRRGRHVRDRHGPEPGRHRRGRALRLTHWGPPRGRDDPSHDA